MQGGAPLGVLRTPYPPAHCTSLAQNALGLTGVSPWQLDAHAQGAQAPAREGD